MTRPEFKAKNDKNQHLADEVNRLLEDMFPGEALPPIKWDINGAYLLLTKERDVRDLHKLFDLDNIPDMPTMVFSDDGGETWSYPIDYPTGGFDPLAYRGHVTWPNWHRPSQQKDTQ